MSIVFFTDWTFTLQLSRIFIPKFSFPVKQVEFSDSSVGSFMKHSMDDSYFSVHVTKHCATHLCMWICVGKFSPPTQSKRAFPPLTHTNAIAAELMYCFHFFPFAIIWCYDSEPTYTLPFCYLSNPPYTFPLITLYVCIEISSQGGKLDFPVFDRCICGKRSEISWNFSLFSFVYLQYFFSFSRRQFEKVFSEKKNKKTFLIRNILWETFK